MGAGQSKSGSNSTKYLDSDNVSKNEQFINMFLRLLTETDIVDFEALSKGPGACGSYIVLLEQNLNKEFNKLQLATTASGKKTVQSFLYTKAKGITQENPTDSNACRELAIFYVRLLQLVGALTLSVYTPDNLADRIRDKAYKASYRKQQKNIPVPLEEQELKRNQRWDWLRKYILSSTSSATPDLFIFKDKPQLKYNKTTKVLTFTDSETNQYNAIMTVEEMDKFSVENSIRKPESYWIVITKPKDGTIIFRSLVHKGLEGYHFEPKPNALKNYENPTDFYKDWTTQLPEIMIESLPKEKPVSVATSQLSQNRFYGGPRLSRNTLDELARAGISTSNLTRRVGGSGNNINSRRNSQNTRKNKTILAKKFKDSYNFMKDWVANIDNWNEAAPALYRTVLLYVKHNTPGSKNSSFICVDDWNTRTMRMIQPFAALEALYYDNDDGTASYANKEKLKNLVDDFKNVYSQKSGIAVNRKGDTFEDVIVPPLPENFMKDFCSKRNAQGEFELEEKYATILEKAQGDIIDLYKVHMNACYSILLEIFEQVKNNKGETTIKFTNAFSTNTYGARQAVEDIIGRARGQIAEHYIQVETIYQKAINDMITATR